jgi:HEPN domain-containing protein
MPKKEKIKNKKVIFAWLQKAEDDFAFAQKAFEETDFYDHVCYLAEQAVEKFLKAIIIIQNGKLTKKEKTHNLLYLSSVCRKTIDLKNFRGSLRRLSEAYIPARYPSNSYIKASKNEVFKRRQRNY